MKITKKFGIAALVIGGLVGAYTVGKNYDRVPSVRELVYGKSIDDLVDEFPSEIPRASEIKKYRVNGSKYLLVHVGQFHNIDPLRNDELFVEYFQKAHPEVKIDELFLVYLKKSRLELVLRTLQSQEDLIGILGYLINRFSLQALYVEGATEAHMRELHRIREGYEKGMKGLEEYVSGIERAKREVLHLEGLLANEDFLRAEIPPGFSNEEYKSYLRQQLEKNRAFLDLYKQMKKGVDDLESEIIKEAGAAGILFLNGVIDLRPAERQGILAKALQIYYDAKLFDKGDINEAERVAYDERENGFLSIACEDLKRRKEKVAVVVYGNAHDWEDNIRKWNDEHLEGKFSLIKISAKDNVKEEPQEPLPTTKPTDNK